MNGNKFRIDAYHRQFILERRRTDNGWLGRKHWEHVSFYETREEARAHYELIKDLPEYLP